MQANQHTGTGQPLRLSILAADGVRFEGQSASGQRIMELVRNTGLPVKAHCNGHGLCACCHVRIGAAWRDRLPSPTSEEREMLCGIVNSDGSSRLACQLVMSPELDGLELEVSPDSLVPQTHWVAG